MIIRSHFFNLFSVFSVLFIVILVCPKSLFARNVENWFYGAVGYENALSLSMKDDLPLIVYFKTDWCGWCKKMEKDYLGSGELKRVLANILKVEINPDNGKAEKSLEKRYGCTGYPSFYVSIPSFDMDAKQLHPFRKQKNWTTAEFVSAIKKKISKLYSNKAYDSNEVNEYAEANRYIDMAIDYNPDYHYLYYLKGSINYRKGYDAKDISILKRAEKNYLQALEIDPDHQVTKRELKQLNEMVEFISKDRVNNDAGSVLKITKKEGADNKVNELASLNANKKEYALSYNSTQKYDEMPLENRGYNGSRDAVVRDKHEELLAYEKAIPHLLQGFGYLGKGDYENAKHEFEKAIEVKPNYSSAHNALSDVCEKLGLDENAKEEKDIAIKWANQY